jgi:hypothetical protein
MLRGVGTRSRTFGPETGFTGPKATRKPAKPRLFDDPRGCPRRHILPANQHFSRPKVTLLKIVVSRVQVPVSPFKNFLQKPHVLSVLLGQISGRTWVLWSGKSRVTARSRIAFPGGLRVSAAEVSIPTSGSAAARRLSL